jgi:hypothetical protein
MSNLIDDFDDQKIDISTDDCAIVFKANGTVCLIHPDDDPEYYKEQYNWRMLEACIDHLKAIAKQMSANQTYH